MKRWIIIAGLALVVLFFMGFYSIVYVVLTGKQILSVEDVSEEVEPVVSIENFAYSPKKMKVSVGTTVEWTNLGEVKQTVTFEESDLMSSSLLEKGEKYSYLFKEPGVYDYYSMPHPYIVGTIVVE